MFGRRYFGGRYFGPRYWGEGNGGAGTALDFEESLVAELLDSAELVALIDEELYPDELPETAELPAVIYQIDTDRPIEVLAGATAVQQADVSILCLALTRRGAKAIANVLRPLLKNFHGELGGTGGVGVAATMLDDEEDEYLLRLDGRDYPLRVRQMNIRFSYE